MIKYVFEVILFAAIVLTVVSVVRWLIKPESKPSGVTCLDELGDEVDQSVSQFDQAKKKLAQAEDKIRELKDKTDIK